MPVFGITEWIIVAAVVSLVAVWIKLLDSREDNWRFLVFCGLLAYFLPLVGPVCVLIVLALRGRRRREWQEPRHWTASTRYRWARDGAR